MISWIITENLLDSESDVGIWNGNKEYIDAGKCKHKFRLRDDDGIVYYEGLSDDCSSFDPLDDFGMPSAGCTDIQYFENGLWEYL